ncbi:MAG: hypothetical protein ABL977_15420, partial [Candidatus Eisenbacteria bacterium]
MKLFALDDEVAELEAGLPAQSGLGQWKTLIEISWQLRQRDGRRAEQLADECEAMLRVTQPLSRIEREQALARLQLVRAELFWLEADLAQAERLADSALAVFREMQDHVGSGDAKWLLAFIHGDRGDTQKRDDFLSLSAGDYRVAGDPLRERMCTARQLLYAAFEDPSATELRLSREHVGLGQQDAAVLAWASSARAIAAGPAGEFGRAIGLFQESHRLALESGQVRQA